MDKNKLATFNKWLIIILVLSQPIINIIKTNVIHDIQVLGFSLFEMFNVLLILCSLLITIYLYKDKKHFTKFLLLIPIFGVYCIFHYINLTHFNLSVYENANPNFLKETYYLFRMFIVPLLLIISLYYSGVKKDSCIRIVETYAFIISFVIVFSNIFLIAHPSYGEQNFITKNIFNWFNFKSYYFYDYYEITSVGLFDSANQISSILFMICPIIMYQAYKKRSTFNYLLLILVSVSMLMLGTKVANVGILLIYVAFILAFIFLKVQRNTHHSIFPILVIFSFTIILFLYSPISYNMRIKLSGGESLSSVQRMAKDKNKKPDSKGQKAFQIYEDISNYDCASLNQKQRDKIELFYTKYNSYIGLSKYITKNYNVKKHMNFWCNYITNYNGTDYRDLKSNIYRNIYKENNNKLDKWLGMGYTSYMIYTESDYSFQFYSYGIIGIIILLGPYFGCIIYLMYNFLRHYKQNFNFENLMYLMGPTLAVVVAYFSGHVFESSFALITLALLIGLNLINFHDKKEYKKKVLFISSTGGHLSELSQLEPIYDNYDYRLVTEKTKSTISLKNKYSKRVNYLIYGTKEHKLVYPFKFTFNCIKSLFIFLIFNPKVIITTGAHTSVPMCYIGKFFGSKIIYIETFANSKTRSLSGRLVYPIADTFIVQWKSMLKLYPKAVYGGWIY